MKTLSWRNSRDALQWNILDKRKHGYFLMIIDVRSPKLFLTINFFAKFMV